MQIFGPPRCPKDAPEPRQFVGNVNTRHFRLDPGAPSSLPPADASTGSFAYSAGSSQSIARAGRAQIAGYFYKRLEMSTTAMRHYFPIAFAGLPSLSAKLTLSLSLLQASFACRLASVCVLLRRKRSVTTYVCLDAQVVRVMQLRSRQPASCWHKLGSLSRRHSSKFNSNEGRQ